MELNEDIINSMNMDEYKKNRKEIRAFYKRKRRQEYKNTPIEFIPNRDLTPKEKRQKKRILEDRENGRKYKYCEKKHNKSGNVYFSDKYNIYVVNENERFFIIMNDKQIEFDSWKEIDEYCLKWYGEKIWFEFIKSFKK